MQDQGQPSSLAERAAPPAGEAAAIAEPGEEQLSSGSGEGSCSSKPPHKSRGSRPPSPGAPPPAEERQLYSQEPGEGRPSLTNVLLHFKTNAKFGQQSPPPALQAISTI